MEKGFGMWAGMFVQARQPDVRMNKKTKVAFKQALELETHATAQL